MGIHYYYGGMLPKPKQLTTLNMYCMNNIET